jgi:hypothetical protein
MFPVDWLFQKNCKHASYQNQMPFAVMYCCTANNLPAFGQPLRSQFMSRQRAKPKEDAGNHRPD